METKTVSCIVIGNATMSTRPPPTVPNERTSLLDKLSGLKHGSSLFTNCYIFHLKQIFAQKRIVLGLNGLSDINWRSVRLRSGKSPSEREDMARYAEKKWKREKKTLKQVWNTLQFYLEKSNFFFKRIHSDAALKTLPIAVISHIPDAFLIGLRIWSLDSGNKDSHWFCPSCCLFKMKPLFRWAIFGVMLQLYKEKIDHFQEIKDN